MSQNDRDLLDQIRSRLQRGATSAEDLCAHLKISQPTLSRTIQGQHDVVMFREPGIRTPRYATTRHIPGIDGGQNLYRIDEDGKVRDFGAVWFLAGGSTLFVGEDRQSRVYEGLPPWLSSARLSGYIGRSMAASVPHTLALPKSLKDWSDDHHLAYIFTQAPDLPGDIVFGDHGLDQHMARRTSGLPVVARSHYPDIANGLISQAVGSSAGGEQPKFVCENETFGHVIVKFAQAGTRSADLLHLEALALSVLSTFGVESAKTESFNEGGYVFLESQRFDRVGQFGRRGVTPIGAIDDELFGARDTWQQFAARCDKSSILDGAEVEKIHKMAAYSQFIGNTDTHFENLSLLTNGNKIVGVAPAYDILPMRYAPLGGGIDPPLNPVEPRLNFVSGNLQAWATGCAAAMEFWTRAKELPTLSAPFRSLAEENLLVVNNFASGLPECDRPRSAPVSMPPMRP